MNKEESIYCKWARVVIESYFNKTEPKISLGSQFFLQKACNVTLYLSDNSIRGSFGSIFPSKPTLKEEIKSNAISAAFFDSRFNRLKKSELDNARITIDVFEEPERIYNIKDLDPHVYGIIVSSRQCNSVLMPAIYNINRPEDQVHLAMKKAGIPLGTSVIIYRFKVNRYER
ncbi:MAG: AMMECR1 domain-containing protein [Bacteroidales bacterium]|nr:AMMECR1 domain-containing protein [Bacteroidales bacterium]